MGANMVAGFFRAGVIDAVDLADQGRDGGEHALAVAKNGGTTFEEVLRVTRD